MLVLIVRKLSQKCYSLLRRYKLARRLAFPSGHWPFTYRQRLLALVLSPHDLWDAVVLGATDEHDLLMHAPPPYCASAAVSTPSSLL